MPDSQEFEVKAEHQSNYSSSFEDELEDDMVASKVNEIKNISTSKTKFWKPPFNQTQIKMQEKQECDVILSQLFEKQLT